MVASHRPAAAIAAILLVLAVAAPARASAGDLDPSFGVDGTTLVGFPEGFDTYIVDMAVQPDGKIVVVGDLHESEPVALPPFLAPSLKSSGEGLVIVRLSADGEADPSFGEGGVVTFEEIGRALDVVIDDQDRIVASGTILAADWSRTISMVRLLSDGSLDPSFGSGGRVTTPSTQYFVNALVIQPDGKIVSAEESRNRAVLRRYEADGSVDTTFGLGGRVSVPHVPEGFTDVELQPDGRLVAVGGSLDPTLLIARFNVDGSLDPTFAGDGMRWTGFGHFQYAFPVIAGIDGSGRVVVIVAEVFVPAFGLAVYTSRGLRVWVRIASVATDRTLRSELRQERTRPHRLRRYGRHARVHLGAGRWSARGRWDRLAGRWKRGPPGGALPRGVSDLRYPQAEGHVPLRDG